MGGRFTTVRKESEVPEVFKASKTDERQPHQQSQQSQQWPQWQQQLEGASPQVKKLHEKVQSAIVKGEVNKFDRDGESILDRVVQMKYEGTEKLLALKMLDDLLLVDADVSTSNSNDVRFVQVGRPCNLLESASHQSPVFIAKLLAAGTNCATPVKGFEVSTLDDILDLYFEKIVSVILNMDYYPHARPMQVPQLARSIPEKWGELKEVILLFCSYGCHPQISWIYSIDRLISEREKRSDWLTAIPFVKTVDLNADKVQRLAEKDICTDLIRCILEQGTMTHKNVNTSLAFDEEWSRLQELVRRERYDLANLFIEYGHTHIAATSEDGELGLKELRKNPNLSIGFHKLSERRNKYLEHLKSLSPCRSSSLSLSVESAPSISLFEVSALLSLIVDCV